MADQRPRSVTLNPGMAGSGDAAVQALKVPPHSVEAEQSLLGGLLLDNTAWDRLGAALSDKDFYRPEHALIYKVIQRQLGITTQPTSLPFMKPLNQSRAAI